AEDGIRDKLVTGVQTCALPISNRMCLPSRDQPLTRLTFDSDTDLVNGWSPDGKHILFASTRGTSFPSSYELYTVPVTGGRGRRKIGRASCREGVGRSGRAGYGW